MTTCIRNASWIVAWQAETGRQAYRRDGDVVFAGDRIVQVGGRYEGPVAREIDGRGRLVMPGLVNLHCHPTNQPLYKGLREELGNPHLYGSGLYDYMTLFQPDADSRRAAAEYTYCELLLSGVTTVTDLSVPYDGWVDLAARSGLRVCIAPMFRSANWVVPDGRTLGYVWDGKAGRRRFDEAVRIVEEAERHACGRLFGMISPGQIDTCEEGLLRDSIALARASRRPFQTHAAQSVAEFNEMTRRHGVTPVQWAHEIGLLGHGTGLGHAIFLDSHDWIHWPTRRDLDLIAGTGTNVAHCPTVFSRYGHTLQDLGRYLRAGITVGLGTDTFPHNMVEEMRIALILARVAAGYGTSVTSADALHCATVGGASALLRDDLGRLAPGAKADLALVDLMHPMMQPARDPLRSMIYSAAERGVTDVFVDGNQVVKDGRVATLDMEDAAARVADGQARMEAATPKADPKGRGAREISPLSLPVF